MRKMRKLGSSDSAAAPDDKDQPTSNDSDSPPPPSPPPPSSDSSSSESISSPPPPSLTLSSPPPSPSSSRDSNSSKRTPPVSSPPPSFNDKQTGEGNKKPLPASQQQPSPPQAGASNNEPHNLPASQQQPSPPQDGVSNNQPQSLPASQQQPTPPQDGASNNEPQNLFLPPPPPPPPPQSGHNSSPSSYNIPKSSATIVAGVLVGLGVLVIILFAAILVACCRKKKKQPLHSKPNHYNGQPTKKDNMSSQPKMSTDMNGNYSPGPYQPVLAPPHPLVAPGFNNNTLTYNELATATQGFSEANLLGQGGFGFVHKGVLPKGKEIAVKSLKSDSGQGEREFQAEVDIISRVHHRHLVSLVGYCIAGGQRMLAYEFVPNNTLEFHLHGKGRPVMDFPSRIKIAIGSAKGLAYLHEYCHPRIIHRDIKTANILLDNAFEAKVADFGLAKFSDDNCTHVSTRVMGTFGYLAPEYAASGKLTDKSDVFSFGVVLLELITGRCAINLDGDGDSLAEWARPQLARAVDEGIFDGLVDPRLGNNFNPTEMTRLVACAASSIRHSTKKRPKMSQIVRALEGAMSLEALNEGVKPGGTMYLGGNSSSSDYDANSYRKDMEKFKRALESEESTSSEYGASN